MNLSLSRNARPGLRVSAAHQQSAWASGDYAVVGNALQIVSEELCDSVNLCQDQRVLDVATGNFHASMAAARRWCDVTATDVTSDLAARRSRQRVEAEAVGVRFVDGDPEALPFADQSFDAVLSSFGAMFALDQERAASEMVRVVRRGRSVGLANWTPEGFLGQLFKVLARFAPATAGGLTSCAWGTPARLHELFGVYGEVDSTVKNVAFRARTPMDWVDKLRANYAPVIRAFALQDAAGKRDLRLALLDLVSGFNRAKDSSMVVDAQYLEVVVRRR